MLFRSVLLVLGAYEPSVWNIRWTPETRIVGVFVSGYHHQAVAGIPRSMPVFIGGYDDKTSCGYFYVTREKTGEIDRLLQNVFGKTASSYYLASNGELNIGNSFGLPTTQSNDTKAENYRDTSAPLAGLAGLDELVKQGKMRLAKAEDYSNGVKSNFSAEIFSSPLPPRLNHLRGYVVLAKMKYPTDLYGANSTTFIVPKGVPVPEGNPGHSRVIDLNK